VKSNPIYKRDTAGKIRTWQWEVEGDSYRTIAGVQGGALVTTGWTKCEPKNVGRANANTAEEQAMAEAVAEMNKKLKREYRATIAELDSVPVGPMLAADYAKLKKPLTFPVYAQPKLDGIRSMTSRHGAFSRELQPHFNVEHIMEALAPLFAKYPDISLDGELYNQDYKDDFNGLVSIIRKQKASPEQKAKAREVVQYHVYDLPSEAKFGDRISDLMSIFKEFNLFDAGSPIKLVNTVHVGTQALLDDLMGEWLQLGYEGQMVRLNAPYDFDTRSKSLLKRKEFITEEFPIKRIEEGNGNWAGFAKRVVLDIPDAPDGEVGAGMRGNQDFAKDLLANAALYKQATIRHFGRTPDGSLRFPVAIDFHTAEGRVD
jgi:DNA ligase-1